MAAWTGKNELNILCKIHALPKTLEDFLVKVSDQPIMRALQEKYQQESNITAETAIIHQPSFTLERMTWTRELG
jgi:hypothetical protein